MEYFLLIPLYTKYIYFAFTYKQEARSESTDIQGETNINWFMISKRKTAERPLVMEFPSAVDISVGESKTKQRKKKRVS